MQEYEWIGLRERDNFAYTLGQEPIYSKDCNNSLIITDKKKGFIKGINNFARIVFQGNSYKIPIKEIEQIINISSKIIGKNKIFYQKPYSIEQRENLEPLSKEKLRELIFECYGKEVISFEEMETKKGNYRVYRLCCKEGKFMFKYRGKDSELFRSQTKITNSTKYIPTIIQTTNREPGIFLNNNIYSLEEFVSGLNHPENHSNYFNLVGKHLSLMHNEIIDSSDSNKNLENKLFQEGIFFNESNLISLYLDLIAKEDNNHFLSHLRDLSSERLKSISNLPEQFIHGDINRSNIIWKRNFPLFIDSENIMFSKRLREFIPTLLFKGNLRTPLYQVGSMKGLIDSYQKYSENPLKEIEKELFPFILKNSLIKLYGIYNIRRNKDDEFFKKQISSSLKILEEEKNVH